MPIVYKKKIGSRIEVFNRIAKETKNGYKKQNLKMNKKGKIILLKNINKVNIKNNYYKGGNINLNLNLITKNINVYNFEYLLIEIINETYKIFKNQQNISQVKSGNNLNSLLENFLLYLVNCYNSKYFFNLYLKKNATEFKLNQFYIFNYNEKYFNWFYTYFKLNVYINDSLIKFLKENNNLENNNLFINNTSNKIKFY